ncbi:MAG: DUF5020 family protein [Bacteroidales bacterium]|nr:DUF5020 family protein [Bacteroidales bacterium]
MKSKRPFRPAPVLTLLVMLGILPSPLRAQQRPTMQQGATNLQVFYDFGSDRKCVTTTLEGFYNDPWGNTFFFFDADYNPMRNGERHPMGAYWEISRCLNFWQGTPLGGLSLNLEYDGGVYSKYGINHAFLAGADYFLHSQDFRNTFNFKIFYKHILYDAGGPAKVPLQFTFVWGMRDLFGLQGLEFSGFLDIWGQDHQVYDTDMAGQTDFSTGRPSQIVALSEPQLWYNVGQHFGCGNLRIGTEIELSYDFGTTAGFRLRPCLGAKWVF